MKKDYKGHLLHINDAIQQIQTYVAEGKSSFLKDRKTQDAVIRQLQIIGEAVKSLPTEVKSKQPEIQWKQIAGMRDKIIHQYFGVDLELVWDVVENHLIPLENVIQSLLKKL